MMYGNSSNICDIEQFTSILVSNSKKGDESFYCPANCYQGVDSYVECYDIIWKLSFGKYYFSILAMIYLSIFIFSFIVLVSYILKIRKGSINSNISKETIAFYIFALLCCLLRIIYFGSSFYCVKYYNLVSIFASLPALLFVIDFMIIPVIFCIQIRQIYTRIRRTKINILNLKLIRITIILFTIIYIASEGIELYMDKSESQNDVSLNIILWVQGLSILICYVVFFSNTFNYTWILAKFNYRKNSINKIKLYGFAVSLSLLFKTFGSIFYTGLILNIKILEICSNIGSSKLELIEFVYYSFSEIIPLIFAIILMKRNSFDPGSSLSSYASTENLEGLT